MDLETADRAQRTTGGSVGRPPTLDVVLAAALLVMALVEERFVALTPAEQAADLREIDVLGEALLLLAIVPFAWRRMFPMTAMVIVIGGYVVRLLVGYPVPTAVQFAAFGALYSVTVYGNRPLASRARFGGLAAIAGALGVAVAIDRIDPIVAVFTGVAAGGVAVFGEMVFVRRRYEATLEERARLLELEREDWIRRAAQDERLRIARELHDVWAHTISVMVMQAGGAEEVLDDHPEQARQALRAIREAGRRALDEVRRLVGTERGDGEKVEIAGIEALDGLAAEMGSAGLPVELDVVPALPELGRDVGLAVYRIVEQALTNTLIHAGQGAAARVRVCADGRDLVIEIVDTGGAPRKDMATKTAGRGLIGMQERVALFKGTLRAERRNEGGFVVRATIPLARTP